MKEKIISETKSPEQKAADILQSMPKWQKDYANEVIQSALCGSKKPSMLP